MFIEKSKIEWMCVCTVYDALHRSTILLRDLLLCFVDLHPVMILVNNQLHVQFFMYVYFYSVHVSGSHIPIIRRVTISMRNLVYVTLCR